MSVTWTAEVKTAELIRLAVDVEIDARREKVLKIYGDAMERAQCIVEELQNAFDRLTEIDMLMIGLLSSEVDEPAELRKSAGDDDAI